MGTRMNNCSDFQNFRDIAGKLSGVWFYACGLFVHVFCLIRSYKTSKYFRLWGRTSREISSTIVEYTKLRLDLNCMCAIVIVSCLGENTLFHVYSMRTGILMKITGKETWFLKFLFQLDAILFVRAVNFIIY